MPRRRSRPSVRSLPVKGSASIGYLPPRVSRDARRIPSLCIHQKTLLLSIRWGLTRLGRPVESSTSRVAASSTAICLPVAPSPTTSTLPGGIWPGRLCQPERVTATCAPSEIAQHHAAFPHIVVKGVGSSLPTGLQGWICPSTIRYLGSRFLGISLLRAWMNREREP